MIVRIVQSRADDLDRDVAPGLVTAAAWCWRLIVVGTAVAVGAFLFWTLRAFAIPFFIAILFATQLLPATIWLERRGLPRWLAVIAMMLALVATLTLLTAVIVGSFVSELDEIGALVSQAADEVARWAQQHEGPLQLSGTDVDDAANSIGPALSSAAGALFGGVLGGASLLAQLIAGIVLALAFLIYLLTDGEQVGAWLVRRFAPARRPSAHRLGTRGWATLGGYVRGVTTVALFDAVLIGGGLALLGVPIAGALTVLVFLAAFIPIAGAWVSGVICVAVALAGNGVTTALVVVVLVLAVQQVESLVLNPIVYRNRVNLHPVVTLGAVTAGGVLAGIIGALIAVPFVALVWAIVDERDHVKEEREQAAIPPPGAGLSPAP